MLKPRLKQWAERQTLSNPEMKELLPLQKQCCHIAHQWQPSESKIWWPYYYHTVPLPREPICLTNEHVHDPQAPRVSTHRGEK